MNAIGAGRVILHPPRATRADPSDGGLGIIRPTFAALCLLAVALFFGGSLRAATAEVIPPAPQNHFNDYARAVRPETAQRLNAELTQFERETSNQLVVAIFPTMQSGSSIEDYTFRVKQAWRVGRADRDNGAVLFVFVQDRTLYVQVGYGLEPVLTDARCKQIIENEITPRFRAGDFDGGVTAGTRALIAAARGEYTGTGRTVREGEQQTGGRGSLTLLFMALVIFIVIGRFFRGNTMYSRRGRISPWIGGGGWGGGSSGGWSGGGGGGGSFSGGGGSGGGGGAGGRW